MGKLHCPQFDYCGGRLQYHQHTDYGGHGEDQGNRDSEIHGSNVEEHPTDFRTGGVGGGSHRNSAGMLGRFAALLDSGSLQTDLPSIGHLHHQCRASGHATVGCIMDFGGQSGDLLPGNVVPLQQGGFVGSSGGHSL